MTKKMNLTKIIFIAGAVFVILSGLLALDLANRGLAWQFFWSQTGEEEPLAQIRGMVEWAGNITRLQPINDPFIPVDHAGDNPYGINTFLQKEVEVDKLEVIMGMISEAGFTWIRQEFPWEDIEVDGRGQYTDSRNDMDGDGTPDTIDAWMKYDRIVDLANQYDIKIQARLSNPPDWTRADDDPRGTGPPDDLQDYVNFATEVATRYKGKITHYQIWNEPNIFPEWGALPDGSPRPVDPERYTEMLCLAYDAIKAVDPEIVVISGALAPTSSLTERDLNDFIFLQRMYDAGAGDCFDVLSMQGYGLNSGPTDRRMRPTNVNYGRNQYIRDIMVANGDAHKPIWISEAAWNFVPTPEENPNIQEPRLAYGQVTQQQAADYMPIAYQRAQEEWAWVGVINYWFFSLPDPTRSAEPMYYFRMVEPDYSPEKPTFTPLPIYDSMKAYITTQTPTLYQGVHQVNGHWAIKQENAEVISMESAQFDQALSIGEISFNARGTDVRVRWTGESLTVTVNDETQVIEAEKSDHWHYTTIARSMLPADYVISLNGEAVIVDSITVVDATFANIYPVVVLMLSLLALLITVLIQRRSV